jgi:hypothetical protein
MPAKVEHDALPEKGMARRNPMKTSKHNLTSMVILITLVSTAALAACSPAVTSTPIESGDPDTAGSSVLATPADDRTTVDDQGSTFIDADSLQSDLSVSSELTEDEILGLFYMREEEKLARDVYLALYDLWGLAIFQNIANSEQSHTDAVKVLLDAYDLEDPVAGNDPGEFDNEDLQALYDQLISLGSQSLSDALKVGAAIEEIDILDIEAYLAQTDNADIRRVYENLMKGSRNHLRAFTSTLGRQTGETYQPQYLSVEVYQSIVDGAMESSGNRGGNRP